MTLLIPFVFLLSAYNSYTVEFSPQGRYFFPAIAPAAILFSAGCLNIFRHAKYRRIWFVAVVTVLIGINVSVFLLNMIGIFYIRAL